MSLILAENFNAFSLHPTTTVFQIGIFIFFIEFQKFKPAKRNVKLLTGWRNINPRKVDVDVWVWKFQWMFRCHFRISRFSCFALIILIKYSTQLTRIYTEKRQRKFCRQSARNMKITRCCVALASGNVVGRVSHEHNRLSTSLLSSILDPERVRRVLHAVARASVLILTLSASLLRKYFNGSIGKRELENKIWWIWRETLELSEKKFMAICLC